MTGSKVKRSTSRSWPWLSLDRGRTSRGGFPGVYQGACTNGSSAVVKLYGAPVGVLGRRNARGFKQACFGSLCVGDADDVWDSI